MTLFQIVGCTLMLMLCVLELTLISKGLTRLRISFFRLSVWFLGLVLLRWPDLTLILASWLSIGRGADVILYLVTLSFLITSFFFLHVLEQHRIQITTLVRELAKQSPLHSPHDMRSDSSLPPSES